MKKNKSCYRFVAILILLVGVFCSSSGAETLFRTPRLVSDNFVTLDQWESTCSQYGTPIVEDTDAAICAQTVAPYLRMKHSVIKIPLPRTVYQDFKVSIRVRHSDVQHAIWMAAVKDDGGAQEGYGVVWDSSLAGLGYLDIRKIARGSAISSPGDYGSRITGTLVRNDTTKLIGEFVHMSLEWECATGTLRLRIDGELVKECTDTDFTDFNAVYLGAFSGSSYYDDLSFQTRPMIAKRGTEPVLHEDSMEGETTVCDQLVDGTSASLVTDPYDDGNHVLELDRGLVMAELDFPLQINCELSAKVYLANAQDSVWIGLFDAEGKHGYAASWDSGQLSDPQGMGNATISKYELNSELDDYAMSVASLDDDESITAIAQSVSSGHRVADNGDYATLCLRWDAGTRHLKLLIDGVVIAEGTDMGDAVGKIQRLYLKSGKKNYFDDICLRVGDDSKYVTMNEMFNDGGMTLETPVDMPLNPVWDDTYATDTETDTNYDRVASLNADLARIARPLPDHGAIEDFPVVNLNLDVRRASSGGRSLYLLLLDDHGEGIGFEIELASDIYNHVSIHPVVEDGDVWTKPTRVAGGASAVFGGLAGMDMHHVTISWDRMAGTFKAYIDGNASTTITSPRHERDINEFSRLMIYQRYGADIRVDNLVVIRVPANAINLREDYASSINADGLNNDLATLQLAFNDAVTAGTPLYIPAGNYACHASDSADLLTLNGAVVIGSGANTILYVAPLNSALRIVGTGSELIGCTIRGQGTERTKAYANCGVMTSQASDYMVSANRVYSVSCAGILHSSPDRTDPSKRAITCGNIVYDSYADGIHMTHASTLMQVNYNTTLGTGDDNVAVVSYAEDKENSVFDEAAPICNRIEAFSNFASHNEWARGLTVIGGKNITYALNEVVSPNGDGMTVYGEGDPYYGMQTEDVVLAHNVIRNSCADPKSNAAIFIKKRDGWSAKNIQIIGNDVYGASRKGLVALNGVEGLLVERNLIKDISLDAMEFDRTTDLIVRDNRLVNIAKHGVLNTHPSGVQCIDRNTFQSILMGDNPYNFDVIHMSYDTGSISSLIITNNVFTQSTGTVSNADYYIENRIPLVGIPVSDTITGNVSNAITRCYGAAALDL